MIIRFRLYKSLNTIRWKHSMANKLSKKNNDNGISQKDMVLTQFGFVGYVLVRSNELGFTDESADRQAFNHFWRVMGHLLGIPDRYESNFKFINNILDFVINMFL